MNTEKQIKLIVLLNRLLKKEPENVNLLFQDFNFIKAINNDFFSNQKEYLSMVYKQVGSKEIDKFVISVEEEPLEYKPMQMCFDFVPEKY